MGSLAIDRTITELMDGAHVELFAGKVFGDGRTHWQPVFYIVGEGVFHRTRDRVIDDLMKLGLLHSAGRGKWKITKQRTRRM